MINSKSVKTEDESPRFIEAGNAPHYTRLFHYLLNQIDRKHNTYEIKTNIWKSDEKTYIEIDLKRKENTAGGIMFHVLKKFVDRLEEHEINIWSIIPAEDNPIEGFITLSGGFAD
ncbi:hypothetical protein CMI37_27405 [Candidatus Pacearchaeota archaeon]|nr:hypothetical protein [Candidatus Pacearchaeota archaeon]